MRKASIIGDIGLLILIFGVLTGITIVALALRDYDWRWAVLFLGATLLYVCRRAFRR